MTIRCPAMVLRHTLYGCREADFVLLLRDRDVQGASGISMAQAPDLKDLIPREVLRNVQVGIFHIANKVAVDVAQRLGGRRMHFRLSPNPPGRLQGETERVRRLFLPGH